MEKTEKTQNWGLTEYVAEGDQRPIFGCPVQGRQFDCRIILFTRQLGVILSVLTYRDIAIKGSGLLSRLLSPMTNTAPFVQVCNVDHIETFLGSASSYQNSVVTWIFRYLQFSYDHPGGTTLFNQFASPTLRSDLCTFISRMIDLLTVAHFFEIGHLQNLTNRFLSVAWSVQFWPQNVPGLLEQTALALQRAARIVPANSDNWFSIVALFRAKWQVSECVDGGHQFGAMLSQLSSIGPFASAWVTATCHLKPGHLDGIFPSSPNWTLQCTECACTACTKGVWRKDLVERTAAEIAAVAVQRYALVNPSDGYKTVFCDYCRRHCGFPSRRGNTPCVPHEWTSSAHALTALLDVTRLEGEWPAPSGAGQLRALDGSSGCGTRSRAVCRCRLNKK